MAFQPVPDVALIRIEGVMDRQLTINTQHWAISGGGITPVNLQTIVAAVGGWAELTLAPLLSRDWTYVRTTGIDLSSATGPSVFVTGGVDGGVDQEAAPNNVAACVKFNTASRGRSFRGRNYVPGIPNNLLTLNTLDPGFMSDLIGAYNLLPGAGGFVAGWEFGVVSRFSEGTPRAEGLFIPITDCSMTTNTVRSMRSREVGHGA